MLKMKILLFLFSLKTAFCTCNPEVKKSGFERGRSSYKVTRLGRMPQVINESSGLVMAESDTVFWTNNDGGSKPVLYKISRNGGIVDSLPLAGIKNTDWEELAKDKAGYVYVGDFGNNLNARKDLAIYKLHPQKPQQIERITYQYQDQEAYPPAKVARNFDCEAFFEHRDHLYLFSKNRGNKTVKMYSLPGKAGQHIAKVADEVYLQSQVTAADINPSESAFALLSYGKVFLFQLDAKEPTFKNPYLCIKLARGQAEALTFINETDFIISNEKGKLFLVEKKK